MWEPIGVKVTLVEPIKAMWPLFLPPSGYSVGTLTSQLKISPVEALSRRERRYWLGVPVAWRDFWMSNGVED